MNLHKKYARHDVSLSAVIFFARGWNKNEMEGGREGELTAACATRGEKKESGKMIVRGMIKHAVAPGGGMKKG